MTPEEMERTMQFILEQQAQLTATVGALAEAQSDAERRWKRTEAGIRNLLAIAEIHDREITAVNERQREADEQRREAEEQRRKDDERARRTDERLDAFINTVERYISERRNGKS